MANARKARELASNFLLDIIPEDAEDLTVIDYACGNGLLSRMLIADERIGRIVGIDQDRDMVKAFNCKVRDQGLDFTEMCALAGDVFTHNENNNGTYEMVICENDEETKPAPKVCSLNEACSGRPIDVIICGMAYHHVDNFQKLTQILAKLLRPHGGILAIIDLQLTDSSRELYTNPRLRRRDCRSPCIHLGGIKPDELFQAFNNTTEFARIVVETAFKLPVTIGDSNLDDGVKLYRRYDRNQYNAEESEDYFYASADEDSYVDHSGTSNFMSYDNSNWKSVGNGSYRICAGSSSSGGGGSSSSSSSGSNIQNKTFTLHFIAAHGITS
ncbi:hypothetical protein V1511DRAFT_512502 [Dipodascopsis uninucleata]